MTSYTCLDTGIHRIERDGTLTRLCPPIAVLGATADPERPAGMRLHLAWSDHASTGTWRELLIPTPLVANAATMEAILAAEGWRPCAEGWHDAVCAAALPHVFLEPMAIREIAAVA